MTKDDLKEIINSPASEITIALATELLSLREQLAELKALEPIGQIVLGDYDSDGTRPARVVCLHDQADWNNFQDGTLLYLETKPAEDQCLFHMTHALTHGILDTCE
jgi:hypothetical protein